MTSFPPIDTVINPTSPRWARMKASAAAAWLTVGYGVAPGPSSGQPTDLRIEVVVAPPQPKLTSLKS